MKTAGRMPGRREPQPTSLSTLCVVGLAADPHALLVLGVLDAASILRRHPTIGCGTLLHASDALLPLLQARCFLFRQRTGFHALIDTLLLMRLARIDAGSRSVAAKTGTLLAMWV